MSFSIQEIDYGIASRIGDNIYINKKIKGYDMGLYMALLEHEEAHTSGYNWNDVTKDIINNAIRKRRREYYSFILTHPSSWTEFLPFMKIEGKWVYSPTMLILYVFLFILLIWGLLL